MTITPETIELLKRLEAAATPKEWRFRDGSDRGMGYWIDAPATTIDNGRGMQYPTQIFGDDDYQSKINDFKFTVAARNHLRELIEWGEGLETRNAELIAARLIAQEVEKRNRAEINSLRELLSDEQEMNNRHMETEAAFSEQIQQLRTQLAEAKEDIEWLENERSY